MRIKTKKVIGFYIVFEVLFLLVTIFTPLNFGHGLGDLGMGAMLLLTIVISVILLILGNKIDNKMLENLIITGIIFLIIYSFLSVSIWKGIEG